MKFTNNYNLPQPLVDAVINDPYDNEGSDFSVTGLINAPRRRILLKRHDDDIEEDVADRLWALFGQIGHGILERAAKDDNTQVIEKRFFAEIDGKKISGQIDLLMFQKGDDVRLRFLEKGVLADYKMMSVWEIVYGIKEEKVAQLNMLAWLCEINGLRVRKLQIVGLLRDWSRTKALQGGNYPKRNIAVIDFPYWSSERTEQYIRDRIAAHVAAEKELPLCTADERWHKDDKFAVMKKGRISALRVCNSAKEANTFIGEEERREEKKRAEKAAKATRKSKAKPVLPVKLSIEIRPGEDTRCLNYCAAAPFCEQFQNILKGEN